MDDGVHLNSGAMGALMDQVITKTEENLAARKRGPTEKAGPAVKKTRVASAGGYKGAGRGGKGGQGGSGGGGGGPLQSGLTRPTRNKGNKTSFPV